MISFGRITYDVRPNIITIVASGLSLKDFNFNKLRDIGSFIITVNGSGAFVPFADAWFTLDPWGLQGPQLPPKPFNGALYAAVPDNYGTPEAIREHRQIPTADVTYLHRIQYKYGLSENPSSICTGNSGFGAFGLAYHMRPHKILLLGMDCGMGYYYTSHKRNRSLGHVPKLFNESLKQMRDADIKVINGSPNSKITCFPRYSIDHALKVITS